MLNKWQLAAIVVIAVASSVLIEWVLSGVAHFQVLFRVFIATSLVGAAIALFDKFLWRISWLQGWFIFRPNISGRWDVRIKPLKADPGTGKPRPARSYKFEIFQTYSKLIVRMTEGPESESQSLCACIRRLENGTYEVIATYLNEPNATVRERSGMHFGTTKLCVEGPANAPTGLKGSYWTDRETRGEIEAVRSND